jgi:hypothetical protein
LKGKIKCNTVNISSLCEGLVIKNYKEMCKILSEDISAGDTKKAQINNWKRYFDFYKEGQQYIITEVYDVPYPSDDARKRREGLYVKYIELLLIEYLSKCEDYKTDISKKALYRILGMTNENYSNFKNKKNYNQLKEKIMHDTSCTITDLSIDHFYQRSDQKLNSILMSALKSMKDRFLIDYRSINTIVVKTEDGEIISRQATDTEDKKILAMKEETLIEMGYRSFSDLIIRGKVEDFFKLLNKKGNERYEWDYSYKQLHIIKVDDIDKQIPIKADEIRRLSYQIQKLDLNKSVVQALNDNAEKKYAKQENQEWGELFENVEYTEEEKQMVIDSLYATNYVEIQKELANYLISLNTTNTNNERTN